MKEYFSKYQKGDGYAVIRRVAPEQAAVSSAWSEHQKYLRSFLPHLSDASVEELKRKIGRIESRTKKYPPTQSVLSELIQLKDALRIREEKYGSPV